MRHPSIFVASWVLLLLLTVAISGISAFSASLALSRRPDTIVAGLSIDELATGRPEAADALRGRRLTASGWALAMGLLAVLVIAGPYRRGERWAWYALLLSFGVSQGLSLLRVPVLGSSLGAGASAVILTVVGIGLLAGVPRMFLDRNG